LHRQQESQGLANVRASSAVFGKPVSWPNDCQLSEEKLRGAKGIFLGSDYSPQIYSSNPSMMKNETAEISLKGGN
jgi:hypothetical protein